MDYEALQQEIAKLMEGVKTPSERLGNIVALALVDIAWSLDSVRDALESFSSSAEGDDDDDDDDEEEDDDDDDDDEAEEEGEETA